LPEPYVSRFWSDIVHGLTPYVPGEQPALTHPVKLNTNENPYPPSPRVVEAIRRELGEDGESLRKYPDPTARALRETVAAYHGIEVGQVFVGNGSDEVLAHTFAALLKQEKPLLFPDVSYSFYPVYAQLTGVRFETVPLDAAMRINVADYRRPCGAIVIANPNAPTGIALPLADIAALVEQHADVPVVIDEAYVDFGAETALPLVKDHHNLLVVRTMSKSRALAGLRVGYAIGDAGLIEALTRVKDSFNSYPLGATAQAGATASIEDEAYFRARLADVIRDRAEMTAGLQSLGLEVLPSATNFVFARKPGFSGGDLAAALRERAVLVRHFAKPRITDYLRITVGTPEQTARLLAALGKVLAGR
jgi:histidinol-phosphate aminotransferase